MHWSANGARRLPKRGGACRSPGSLHILVRNVTTPPVCDTQRSVRPHEDGRGLQVQRM